MILPREIERCTHRPFIGTRVVDLRLQHRRRRPFLAVAMAADNEYPACRQNHDIHIGTAKFMSAIPRQADPAMPPLNSMTSAVLLLRAVAAAAEKSSGSVITPGKICFVAGSRKIATPGDLLERS